MINEPRLVVNNRGLSIYDIVLFSLVKRKITTVTLKSFIFFGIIKWVMIMIAMERFIQRVFILVLVTMIECMNSNNCFVHFFLLGCLLCIICERSLFEKEKGSLLLLQFLLCLAFVLLSKNYISYLLFYLLGSELPIKIRGNRKDKTRNNDKDKMRYEQEIGGDKSSFYFGKNGSFLFPSMMYFCLHLILKEKDFPEVLLHSLILIGITGILFVFQQLIENYINARSQASKAISVMAVNEMYAKKLNQELVIKNYLADKTARLEERENISRNIHNSVGHSITAAVMTLDAADLLFDMEPKKAREKMNAANQRIRGSLDSIRQAVRVLDRENRYVSMRDFISELMAVTDDFMMDTTIKVYTDFEHVNLDVNIPHEHTEFLTGVVQELLSNGVRHGDADIFTLSLVADSRHMKIKVIDNGKSDFGKENQKERIKQGFGLKKIISYVERCGGKVDFSNENGFKTEILLEFQ